MFSRVSAGTQGKEKGKKKEEKGHVCLLPAPNALAVGQQNSVVNEKKMTGDKK